MSEEPILRFKKPTIVWRGILFVLMLPSGVLTFGVVAYALLIQGKYSFILPFILMIGFAYF